MNAEIKPSFVPVFLVRRTVVGHPEEEFVLLEPLGDFRQISGTKIAIKRDNCVFLFIKFLRDTLRML